MAREAPAPPSPLKGGRLPAAVKAGRKRVSKKQENGAVEKNLKNPGKEKTRGLEKRPYSERCKDLNLFSLTKRRKSSFVSVRKMQNMGDLLANALEKISHKFPAAAAQVAHQKPRPALEKIIWPKRIYIIQQPRKC